MRRVSPDAKLSSTACAGRFPLRISMRCLPGETDMFDQGGVVQRDSPSINTSPQGEAATTIVALSATTGAVAVETTGVGAAVLREFLAVAAALGLAGVEAVADVDGVIGVGAVADEATIGG